MSDVARSAAVPSPVSSDSPPALGALPDGSHLDFAQLVEALDVAVVVQDHRLRIIYANPKATSLLGLSATEITSRTTNDARWDVIGEDGKPVPDDAHPGPTALRTGRPVSGAVLGVRRGEASERVWLLVHAVPKLAADGTVERVVISFSDVSISHRSIREHEAMYQSVFRSMSEGLVVHNMDGSIREANAAAERVLGLSIEQMRGRLPLDPRWRLVRPDQSPVGPDFIPSEITTRTGEPSRAVIGVHRPTGELAWLDVQADPLRELGECQMSGVVATFVDITVERTATMALEASRAQLQRVLDAVPGVVFTFRHSDNGRVEFTFAAGRIHEVTGLDADAVRGTPSLLLSGIAAETLVDVRALVARAASQRAPYEHVVELTTPAGEKRWVRTVGIPAESADGLVYTAFSLDVTREHQMEDALRRSRRREALGDMAAGIAHNFNNMLAVILPNVQLAREQVHGEVVQHLSDAERAAVSAGDLVKRMLALGHAEVRPGMQVDLVPLLRDSLHMCRQTFDKSIIITDEITVPDAHVRGASSAVQQVIINMLLNARDALLGVSSPTLRVTLTGGEQDSVVLTIADSGAGMSAETLRRIGEPFYTTKGPASGTGLGLASAFHTINEAGGSWRVESTPGQGTTFVITLPRVAAVKSVLSPSTPTPKPTLTGAVLIIDDEPMVRGVLARQMSKAGMRSVPVSGAEEALALLRSGTVDDLRLILLDLSMPDMSGDAALPLLREAAPHVPVIALSGHVPESLDLPGAAAVLQKPIGQRELVAAVAQALG
jgi:two-component system cell cycle sensor histidine kinase/response regulator CckA